MLWLQKIARSLALLISIQVLCFAPTHVAVAQENSAIVQEIQRLELNVKSLIGDERKERIADFRELKAMIDALKKGTGEATSEKKVTAEKKEKEIEHVNPKELIDRLKAGNVRFVKNSPSKKDLKKERAALTTGQHPYAIVLTCADSRVPPEMLFDESLGKIFVVRDAGNLVDSVILGSIEYAAEHLHVGLFVVLGHESCGAIKATIAGGEVPPNIGSLVKRLIDPVNAMKAKGLKENELVTACVKENVRYQAEQAKVQSGVLEELVKKNELTIVGAVYNLETGIVSFQNE